MQAFAKPREIPAIEVAEIEAKSGPFLRNVMALQVTTREEDEVARREFLAGKEIEKLIKATFEKPKEVAFKAHKEMVAAEKEYLEPIQKALDTVNGKVLAFKAEQDRKAREEAERLAAEARRLEEDRKLHEAAAAEAAGDKEAAEAILNEPTAPVAIAVESDVAKVAGVGTRSTWSAEVHDLKALVKWVAARMDSDPAVLAYLQPGQVALNKIAQAQRKLMRIDGVVAKEKTSLSGRTI
jgi:colicin import membrane protein